MTFDDVRRLTLAWPEVEDGTSYGTPALKVHQHLLARLKEDRDSLVMPGVLADERDLLVASRHEIFYFTDHYSDHPMVLIRLSKAKRAVIEPLLRRRWQALASKAAVRTFDARWWRSQCNDCRYRTTPEIKPALRRGGLISFFRKQRASRPT